MRVTPSAMAANYKIGSIEIIDPWSRATPKGGRQGEDAKGTLLFEHAGAIEIEYNVQDIGAQSATRDMGHMSRYSNERQSRLRGRY